MPWRGAPLLQHSKDPSSVSTGLDPLLSSTPPMPHAPWTTYLSRWTYLGDSSCPIEEGKINGEDRLEEMSWNWKKHLRPPHTSGSATTVINQDTLPENVALLKRLKPVMHMSKTIWTKRRISQMFNKRYTPPIYWTMPSKPSTPFPSNRKTLWSHSMKGSERILLQPD